MTKTPRAVILLAGGPGTGKSRAARILFVLLESLGFVVDVFSSLDPDQAIKAAVRYGNKTKWIPEEEQ
jgi:Mg-chelatase subunit ChlI